MRIYVVDPLLQRIIGLRESEDGKIKPDRVTYLNAEQIGDESGAHCGACFFFHRPSSQCFLTSPPKCNAEHGVCDFYLHGNLWNGDDTGKTKPTMQELVSKESAGYTEEGPTHCANCEYFQGNGSCKKVKGTVEENGCCNHWDGGDED